MKSINYMVDQRSIRKRFPKIVKREVGNHALSFGTLSAMKKYSVMYPKFTFIRTSVNMIILSLNNPNVLKGFGGTVELTNR